MTPRIKKSLTCIAFFAVSLTLGQASPAWSRGESFWEEYSGKWNAGSVSTLHCTESSSLVGFEVATQGGTKYLSLPISFDFCLRLQADQSEAQRLHVEDVQNTSVYLGAEEQGVLGFRSFVNHLKRAIIDRNVSTQERAEILRKLQ